MVEFIVHVFGEKLLQFWAIHLSIAALLAVTGAIFGLISYEWESVIQLVVSAFRVVLRRLRRAVSQVSHPGLETTDQLTWILLFLATDTILLAWIIVRFS